MLVAYCRLCCHCRNLAERGCLVWFHFTRSRYFLGHVACRNLPWQGLASGFFNLNDFLFYLRDTCVTCKPRIGGKYKYADWQIQWVVVKSRRGKDYRFKSLATVHNHNERETLRQFRTSILLMDDRVLKKSTWNQFSFQCSLEKRMKQKPFWSLYFLKSWSNDALFVDFSGKLCGMY